MGFFIDFIDARSARRFLLPAALLAFASCSPSASEIVVVAATLEASAVPPAPPSPPPPPPPAPPPDPEWRVGVFLPMTGNESDYGSEVKHGIEIAFDEVSPTGIKGRPVKVVYADDRSQPREAADRAADLIERDRVIALVGEVASARSKAAGIVANARHVPLVVPASTNPDVTRVGPFVFRACFADDAQARAAAQYMVTKLGKKRIGILHASDVPYSALLAGELRSEAKRLGATIVTDQTFLQGDTNFKPILATIRAAKPDFVYVPLYHTTMIPVAKAAKAAGMSARLFFGGDAWGVNELLDRAGDELEGALFTEHWAIDAPSPESRAFVSRYRARFDVDPTGLAAIGYDAAKLVADALGRAREATPEAVRDALQETRGFVGVTGKIDMRADREPDKSIAVVAITKRKFSYRDAVSPAR